MVQINLLVSSWFATHLPAGTVAYLFYADRLVQLPLGIVGVALGTALLPALSLAVREGRLAQGVLNRAVELALLLALPAAVGLVLLAQPIIQVLFERGAFGAGRDAGDRAGPGRAGAGPAGLCPGQGAGARLLRAGGHTHAGAGRDRWRWASTWRRPCCSPGRWGMSASRWRCRLSSWANALGPGVAALAPARLLRPDAGLARRGLGILAAVAVMAAVLLAGRAGLGGDGAATLGLLIAAGGLAFLVAGLERSAPSISASSGGCGAPRALDAATAARA